MKRKPPAMRGIGIGLNRRFQLRPSGVSGHPSRLHDRHLCGWRPSGFQMNVPARVVTGKLRLNLGPGRVRWRSLAGRSFTHRQTVKRKAGSRGRRYAAMLRAERLAALSAMMAVGWEG